MLFLKVLRQRHLALLWSSQVLSAMGDYFYQIAVMWIAIKVAGSAGGIVVAAESGAALFFGLLGGVYADRWNRRTTMIVVDMLRAFAIGTLPVLAILGTLQLWYLVLVAIVVGSLSSLFDPALQASLPALAGDAQTLQATNGLMDITRRLARALGPGMAGVVLLFLPLTHFFTLDAISFVISAGAVLLLGRSFVWQVERIESTKRGISGIVGELADAVRLVRKHPAIWWTIIAMVFIAGAWSAAFVVGVPLLAARVLKSGVGTYGLIVGAYGVGNVLSNLVIGSVTIRRRVLLMLLGRLVVGGGFLLMISVPTLPVALLGSALAATGGPMGDIPLTMMIQTELPGSHIGKVYSLLMTVSNSGSALGLLLAVPLFHYLSVSFAIACCALVIAGTSVIGLMRFGFKDKTVQ